MSTLIRIPKDDNAEWSVRVEERGITIRASVQVNGQVCVAEQKIDSFCLLRGDEYADYAVSHVRRLLIEEVGHSVVRGARR